MAGPGEGASEPHDTHGRTSGGDSGPAHAATVASDVPGLVPVTLEPERLQLIGVRIGTVAKRSLDGGLRLLGFVTPDETRLANVHVRFSGWVRELSVDQTGQTVKADQKLLTIYSQELYQAEQEYLLAKQSLQATTDRELSAVRRRLFDASRQRLELLGIPAEERLRLETEGQPRAEPWIRSPRAGVVLEKNVLAGQFIGPDRTLFTLADLSRVWVLADVYERDLARIGVGQKVRLTTSAYPGATFAGKVGFIYPSVSEDTRTLKVRIEFDNADGRLKPGLYAEIDVSGGEQEVLTIPADAVMDEGARQYAFVVHDGTHFEPRLLSLGHRSDDYAEVLSGLSEGEQVVTSANFLIDSESRLKAAMSGMTGSPAESHTGHGQ
jgi:Cu(I)/Ag(I) efflux system membrane fusion protein